MDFEDNYKWISGWIHDYYCNNDGAELIFDLNNSETFECPICKHVYNDSKKKKAWITKYRYTIFQNLENYSFDYLKNKDSKTLEYIEDALNYYSLNYDKFPIHDKTGETFNASTSKKCGRITTQGLNEAMITIQIINCLNNVSQYLQKQTKSNVFSLLFPKIFALLRPQINKIHNIDCYEICAIAMIGIVSNNKEMIDFAFNSSYSFYTQLDKGVTKDYFWFEGSFHYHFFILEPILELLKVAKQYQFNIPNKYYSIAKKMLIQGYRCSFNDCYLPSPNDGWPNRHLSHYLDTYYLGNKLFKNEFTNIIEAITKNVNTTNTRHLTQTGFSILKNKSWNVFIKYKDNNLNHAHPDKLNIEIKWLINFLTHDLSTSGYGSQISKEFYKKSYSHNTIIIDGKDSNIECDNIINKYNNHMISVTVNNLYDNISVSREIKLANKTLKDKIKVNNNSNQSIDYIFHCDATILTELKTKIKKEFKKYPYFKNIKEVITDSKILTLKWKLNKTTIISKINLENKHLFICNSPDNPNTQERTTLIIRSNNEENPLFKIEWKCF